ncbi:MAG: biosynthetic peptidoglycan transglycosylase [Bacteroidota bacterium]
MKKTKKIAIYSIISLTVLFGLFFILRGPILSWYIDKKIKQFNIEYSAQLKLGKHEFVGLSGIKISDLSLKEKSNDTLLTIKDCYVKVNIFKSIFGGVNIGNIELNQPQFSFISDSTHNNYNFLLKNKKTKEDTIHQKNYAEYFNSIISKVFDKLPSTFDIKNLKVLFSVNKYKIQLSSDNFSMLNEKFNALFLVEEDSLKEQLELTGSYDKEDKTGDFNLKSIGNDTLFIPYIKHKYQLTVGFSELTGSMNTYNKTNDNSEITGVFSSKNFICHHWRISPDNIEISKVKLNYSLLFGEKSITLDSTSIVEFNKLKFRLFSEYINDTSKKIKFFIPKLSFKADDFFSSLPKGLFSTLEGIKTSGDLSFFFNFDLDLAQIDSLKFKSELAANDLKINSMGRVNFKYVNDTFTYNAYDKGVLIRKIIIGPSNPNYRSLAEIPDILKYSVINSEDGWFFGHRGFLPDAIRESLIADIKVRRFVRGGSTISMQLVKNLFLNRNKNISRKVEEMLITWLIENNRWISKERMIEIYLNIIEWGPGIYGANEAAKFYFDKDVSKLTLAESIYLASIIPRPKLFKYSFDETGMLKEYIVNYYQRMADKMLKKEYISQSQYDELKTEVTIKGPAKYLLRTDSLKPDSIVFIKNY